MKRSGRDYFIGFVSGLVVFALETFIIWVALNDVAEASAPWPTIAAGIIVVRVVWRIPLFDPKVWEVKS